MGSISMRLDEAQQILEKNGFLMETITEDILSDILWDNLNTDTNTSMQGIRKVCDFLEYDLGKPIERASVKRIAETIVKLYNLGYESERFHPNHQRKIELKDAIKAATLIKSKAKETMTEGTMSLEDKIHNAKAYNIERKLRQPTKDDLYGYRRLCTAFASLKKLIVDDLKYYFDEDTITKILKSYGDTIYFNAMKSQLPSDELARYIVEDLLDELT